LPPEIVGTRAAFVNGARPPVSGNNRNVLILRTFLLSAVRGLPLLPLEPLPPRVIFGWTPPPARGILRAAVGRIGLRRSATRAPAGRLYARRPGLLNRARVCCFPAGIGR